MIKLARPKLSEFITPKKLTEIPTPIAKCGFLVETNAGWRNSRPVFEQGKCVNCLQCYLLCPEGAIYKSDNKIAIDYDFCKGCGICVHECKLKAIIMIPEEA